MGFFNGLLKKSLGLSSAQIGFPHGGTLTDLLGVSLEHDLAYFQNVSPAGDLQGHMRVLLHQQNGFALAMNGLNPTNDNWF